MTLNLDIKASAPETVPDELILDGVFEITAKEGDSDQSPVRFTLSANSGSPMQLGGFGDPVIVDLTGAKFDKKITPVIADHDTTKRIGHTVEQVIIPAGGSASLNGKTVKGPFIGALGQVSSSMGIAKGFVEDAKAGFPFQVSIGARMQEAFYVDEGEKVEVNGKTHKGPLIVANKTLIRELTVTVLGADNNTSAKLAANALPLNSKGNDMTFEAFVKSLGLDPEKLSDDQKTKLQAHWKAQQGDGGNNNPNPQPNNNPGGGNNNNNNNPDPIKAKGQTDLEAIEKETRKRQAVEIQRIDGIQATARKFDGKLPDKFKIEGKETEFTLSTLKSYAIEEGWTADDLELHCLRNERPQTPIAGGGFAIHANDHEIQSQALEASIMRTFGFAPMREKNTITGKEYGIETMFKPEVLEASHRPEYNFGGSLQALLDIQIRAAGLHYPGSSRKGSDFVATAVKAWETIKASGFSNLSITNILENTMHKTSLAAFESVESLWRFITGRRTLSDFRPHNLYRLTADGSFRQVGQTGELKHVGMSDEKFSISADTFGAMITIDRKTIKNDDLGLVLDQARGIGMLGGQRIEESVFALLLSNPSSFYHADNNNLLTGAGSALSVDALTDARESFRNQVNSNGKPIGVSPRILLAGTTLETTANRLWAEERLEATGSSDDKVFVNNPHKGLYRPYISPYLNNTNITDQDGNALSGQSDTQWYLFADPSSPQGASIVIGFVDGRDTPFFDEAETTFNVPGGMQFRSYLDWGVAMHATELSLKSAGA